MKRIKDLIERSVDIIGYSIMPRWMIKKLTSSQLAFQDHLTGLFSDLSIDTVIDVGANKGQYKTFLREKVGFRGRIFSFEPIPALAAELRERAKSDRLWEVFNLGVGSADGTLSLNIMKYSVFSSFLNPTTEHTKDFDRDNSAISKEEVEVKTIQSLIPELGLDLSKSRTYLKIDTQGYDLEVLKGCGETLNRFLALQTELSVTPIYENMPSYIEVLTYLNSRNFAPSGFFRVSSSAYKMIEVDCCMINNNFRSM